LDDLVAIKGKKLKSFQESLDSPMVELIHSLKESKVEKVIKKSSTHLLKYCEEKLIRTYPDNFRIDSSNYDPMPAWNYGCQVVALNYQTSVMQIPAVFRRGHSCVAALPSVIKKKILPTL
jgi:hypothetical protein